MIGTSDPTTSNTLTITSDGPWGGGVIQVTSPFLLTQIDVGMYIGAVPVTLQFTDALGASATPESILASTTVSYSWGYHVVSIPAAVTLQPGTYYLLGSTSAYQGQPGGTPFFPLATSTLTSAYGAPAGIFLSSGPHDTAFPPGGSFTFSPTDRPHHVQPHWRANRHSGPGLFTAPARHRPRDPAGLRKAGQVVGSTVARRRPSPDGPPQAARGRSVGRAYGHPPAYKTLGAVRSPAPSERAN